MAEDPVGQLMTTLDDAILAQLSTTNIPEAANAASELARRKAGQQMPQLPAFQPAAPGSGKVGKTQPALAGQGRIIPNAMMTPLAGPVEASRDPMGPPMPTEPPPPPPKPPLTDAEMKPGTKRPANVRQVAAQEAGPFIPGADFTPRAEGEPAPGALGAAALPDMTMPQPAATPEEQQQRVKGWQDYLSSPGVRAALLAFGTRLMQPVPVGQTRTGQMGVALREGAMFGGQSEAAEEQAQLARGKAAREEKKVGFEERETVVKEKGAETDKARVDAIRQGMEVERAKLKRQEDKDRVESIQKEVELRIKAGELDVSKENAISSAWKAAVDASKRMGPDNLTESVDETLFRGLLVQRGILAPSGRLTDNQFTEIMKQPNGRAVLEESYGAKDIAARARILGIGTSRKPSPEEKKDKKDGGSKTE